LNKKGEYENFFYEVPDFNLGGSFAAGAEHLGYWHHFLQEPPTEQGRHTSSGRHANAQSGRTRRFHET